MGRELKRVPMDFDLPIGEVWPGSREVLYTQALGEMLIGLPPEEVVDSISLENNTTCDRRGSLRPGSPSWMVVTVVPAGCFGLRKTFWRGYLDGDTNTSKLANIGTEFHQTP